MVANILTMGIGVSCEKGYKHIMFLETPFWFLNYLSKYLELRTCQILL